jgi:antitoxin component YwqK of YwqJK toxin-antitoxin module
MKYFLAILSFAFIVLLGSCNLNEPVYYLDGFTNRKEAKNLMVDGEKEGKWVQYGYLFWILKFDTLSYTLTIYKHDVPYGTVKKYYMNGHLEGQTFYKDGKVEGVARGYYKSGQLRAETHFTNGLLNGPLETYFSNGAVDSEATYVNGAENGIVRHYHPNGLLQSETTWKDGKMITTKDYPENDYH